LINKKVSEANQNLGFENLPARPCVQHQGVKVKMVIE